MISSYCRTGTGSFAIMKYLFFYYHYFLLFFLCFFLVKFKILRIHVNGSIVVRLRLYLKTFKNLFCCCSEEYKLRMQHLDIRTYRVSRLNSFLYFKKICTCTYIRLRISSRFQIEFNAIPGREWSNIHKYTKATQYREKNCISIDLLRFHTTVKYTS